MLTVIAYDIVDDRRRDKVSTLLADHGRRVNYSVFECVLGGEELTKLRARLEGLIDGREDRLVFYRICRTCRGQRSMIGTPLETSVSEPVVVV